MANDEERVSTFEPDDRLELAIASLVGIGLAGLSNLSPRAKKGGNSCSEPCVGQLQARCSLGIWGPRSRAG
jgi:hypothetical protein